MRSEHARRRSEASADRAGSGRPGARPAAAVAGAVVLALLALAPAPAAAQASGSEGVALEVRGGGILPADDVAAFADPGYSAGVGVAVPVHSDLFLRLDGDVDLPFRDVADGPLINLYSATAGLEYVATQADPGRPPLRTAFRVGAGATLLDAVETPVGAPAGASFRETYLTLTAGLRVGYRVARGVELFLAPGVRWFDLPAADADRLTAGLGVASPDYGWFVPVQAGARFTL